VGHAYYHIIFIKLQAIYHNHVDILKKLSPPSRFPTFGVLLTYRQDTRQKFLTAMIWFPAGIPCKRELQMYSICLPFVWDTPLVDKVTSLPPHPAVKSTRNTSHPFRVPQPGDLRVNFCSEASLLFCTICINLSNLDRFASQHSPFSST